MKAKTNEDVGADSGYYPHGAFRIFDDVLVKFVTTGTDASHCIYGARQATYGAFLDRAAEKLAQSGINLVEVFVGTIGDLHDPPAETTMEVLRDVYGDKQTGVVTVTYL